ncbi:membrane protein [Luteipulveratus mongoliensis]|uniref:Membrane protein n=2 Tax=Luteipulveratus mongoliensis TaxID=571913 RepID=A0A0K1JQR8_9MICO|nr:membrane protein [Luteipulveratus mongoliensis]
MLVGHRLPERTRSVVTDCLGLVTLLMAALSAYQVTAPSLEDTVGDGAPVLIVLGSLLIGSIAGSLLQIERRLEGLAGVLQRRMRHDGGGHAERERFIEGWMTASLLFCVGPLTILGTLSDGLGRGIDQLVLKSVLDGFAALAFASTFGIGVLMSALSVAVIQGSLTVLGVLLGSVLPDAHIAALTATGGLLLVGIGLRLLRIREIPVGDMLPAIVVAPLLTALVAAFR